MIRYDPKIHHRRSIRLGKYDYSWAGYYFITLCTREQRPLFGNIVDAEMRLNVTGRIVHNEWLSIPLHYPKTVLHEFIVMPNHIHGIIEIVNARPRYEPVTQTQTLPASGGFSGVGNPMLNTNLARIIRWYKGRTAFECHKNHPSFAWQRNYYEHIIRGDYDYYFTTEYIRNNPTKWTEDRFWCLNP